MEDVGEFLLQLYRAARECDPEAFQGVVLERLQASFAFAAAFWGAGRFTERGPAFVPVSLHISNIDPDFLRVWPRVQHDDPVVSMLRSAPGRAQRVHVPSFYAPTPELAEFGRAYRIQSMTVISMPDAAPQSLEWLSLYRENPDAHCSDDEKRWLEFVAPHLGEAWRINRALNTTDAPGEGATGIAVADAANGLLLCADSTFLTLLAREWRGFDGRHVPAMLQRGWQGHRIFVHLARHCRIDGRNAGELVYLAAREKAGTESLTPRQIEIAGLYSQGLSSKQIAQRCGLSPATVRNHLAMAYAALGVHGKIELAQRLARLRG